jgi:hypothetical protein
VWEKAKIRQKPKHDCTLERFSGCKLLILNGGEGEIRCLGTLILPTLLWLLARYCTLGLVNRWATYSPSDQSWTDAGYERLKDADKRETTQSPEVKARFVEPVLLLRTERLAEGPA